VGARGGVGQTGVGANAQANGNVNGLSPTPFFADPGARQQLGLNNNQFNRLNAAYQRALERQNRRLARMNTAGAGTATPSTNSGVTATAPTGSATDGASGAQRTTGIRNDQRLQARANAGTVNDDQRLQARDNANGEIGEDRTNARSRQEELQQFSSQFDSDFNGVVDSTFTDPAMRQRFNQLNLQHQGFGAFTDPQIAQQLNLTAQQRQQLRALAGEWRQQLRQLQAGRRTNLTAQQFNALRSQFLGRLNTVLTPEQQQQWAQLIGPVHNFPMTAFLPPGNDIAGDARATTPAQSRSRSGVVQGNTGTTEGGTTGRIAPYGGTSRSTQGSRSNSGTTR
jgi:hypothetical protein